jgi:hypothetical protein
MKPLGRSHDKRWFRPAHHQENTLHVFGLWFGWYFIGIQVGKAWPLTACGTTSLVCHRATGCDTDCAAYVKREASA